MGRVISLGLSCQSRFCIDMIRAEHRRAPFDYTVTTTAGLLQALRSDGEAFRLTNDAALSVYRAPREGREGVLADGVYLWHDFDVNEDGTIVADWRSALPEVREKYAVIWGRFRQILAQTDEEITFVLSNTQVNLGEYAANFDDFQQKFRFTPGFVAALQSALAALGARNFRILLLNRYLRDSIELNHAFDTSQVRSVFCGPLTLPTEPLVVFSTLLPTPPPRADLAAACKRYADGRRIVQLTEDSAAITRDGDPVGELRTMRDGYIAAFEGVPDAIRTAILAQDGALYWSDKSRWKAASGD